VRILVAIYSEFQSWCIPDAQLEQLRAAFPEHTFVRADSDEAALEAIPDAEIAFSSRITPEHLAAAPRLRWVHSPAAGVGSMLFPEMVRSAVVMTNSRGNSSVTIAEHVIAVTLVLLRDLRLAWRRQNERVWAQNEFDAGASIRTLRGARVLIVGLGSIGSETARLVSAFGARVVGIRRTAAGATAPEGVNEVVGPAQLIEQLPSADVVVVSAPQTAETVHMIGERELSRMKADSILVNVSRGKLIDEAALVRALDSGRLRGAALDVFEHEPLDPASPLWTRPEVLITPHVSGFHAGHWPRATQLFADNLHRFAAGRPLANVVNKEAGY
jgi:phosphoglycerate dehydrogenase-like enzyme